LQLPNDSPAKQRPVPDDDSALTILQICIPTTATSAGLQASNNRQSILNDVTSPQAFSLKLQFPKRHKFSSTKTN
jgi:hypothetical protein